MYFCATQKRRMRVKLWRDGGVPLLCSVMARAGLSNCSMPATLRVERYG